MDIPLGARLSALEEHNNTASLLEDVLLAGDFNARVGVHPASHVLHPQSSQMFPAPRGCTDYQVTPQGHRLLDLCSATDTVLLTVSPAIFKPPPHSRLVLAPSPVALTMLWCPVLVSPLFYLPELILPALSLTIFRLKFACLFPAFLATNLSFLACPWRPVFGNMHSLTHMPLPSHCHSYCPPC
jgi:hypothetical protein